MNTRLVLVAAIALCAVPARAQCPSWTGGFERPGSDHSVRAAVGIDHGSGEVLYVGGEFTAVGGVDAARIASFDGSAWAPLGEGVDGVTVPGSTRPAVHAIAAFDDGSGSLLFAGGKFETAGGEPAQSLARWDGSSWSPVASGFAHKGSSFLPNVLALSVFDDGSGPALFVGGNFQVVDGLPVGGLARWDGVSWTDVGGGTNGTVNDLLVFDDGSGPALFVAGTFDEVGGVSAGGIARWDGGDWTALVGGSTPQGVANLAVFDDGGGPALHAASYFGPGAPRYVARWDGTQWTLPWMVDARDIEAYDAGSGPVLYAMTSPEGLKRLTAGGVVELIGGIDGGLRDGHVVTEYQGELLAGGHFETIESRVVNNLASWDGASFSAVGTAGGSMSDSVRGLLAADLGSGPRLYVAGSFDLAGSTPAQHVAAWDGTSWSALGQGVHGVNAFANALEVFDHGTGPGLYVGGSFNNAGTVGSLLNIARWDGAAWSGVGSLTHGNQTVNALEVFDDGTGAALFAAGGFEQANGVPVGKIARYDGESWSALGTGIGGLGALREVLALAVYDDGGGAALFAAGTFTSAGGLPANRIATWDGSSWSDVGGGMTGASVNALAVHDDGGGAALYAGGDFVQAGGAAVSNLARWNGAAWSGLSGGDPDAPVHVLAVHDDGSGPALRVGGEFTSVGALAAEHAATWQAGGWSSLGAGVGDKVLSFATFDDGSAPLPSLYAGGDFTVAGGLSSGRIARWSNECSCQASSYCTAGTTTNGCNALMAGDGTPSAAAVSGFVVTVSGVEGQKQGLLYFGTTGAKATPWGAGSSFRCVAGPHQRTQPQGSGGTAGGCDGAFALDFSAWMASHPAKAPPVGQPVWMQAWFRDPPAPLTTSFSDALTFTVCP